MRRLDGVRPFEGKQLLVDLDAPQVDAKFMLGSNFVQVDQQRVQRKAVLSVLPRRQSFSLMNPYGSFRSGSREAVAYPHTDVAVDVDSLEECEQSI